MGPHQDSEEVQTASNVIPGNKTESLWQICRKKKAKLLWWVSLSDLEKAKCRYFCNWWLVPQYLQPYWIFIRKKTSSRNELWKMLEKMLAECTNYFNDLIFFLLHSTGLLQVAGIFSKFLPKAWTNSSDPHFSCLHMALHSLVLLSASNYSWMCLVSMCIQNSSLCLNLSMWINREFTIFFFYFNDFKRKQNHNNSERTSFAQKRAGWSLPQRVYACAA